MLFSGCSPQVTLSDSVAAYDAVDFYVGTINSEYKTSMTRYGFTPDRDGRVNTRISSLNGSTQDVYLQVDGTSALVADSTYEPVQPSRSAAFWLVVGWKY